MSDTIMTGTIFKNRKMNTEKLLRFGFIESDNSYVYHTDLVGGQMRLTVKIDSDGKIDTEVVDHSSGEEYVLHQVDSAVGSFVGQVRDEYESVLEKISEACCTVEVFKSAQAKEVIAYIHSTYRDGLEYLWKKFPENAVVRRKDNQKWYAALLTVSRRKLGFDAEEKAEILDLRMTSEEIETAVDGVKILPGYHMNKKHWITICLDSSVPIDEICKLIDESYVLAKK